MVTKRQRRKRYSTLPLFSVNNNSTTTTSIPLSSESNTPQQDDKLLQELKQDFDQLSKLRPNDPSQDFSQLHKLVSAGSSYTRVYTAETWHKHSQPAHQRYARHIGKWHLSSTARNILPAVLLATSWATLVAGMAHRFQLLELGAWASASTSAISFLTAPLALLLTLRANASLSRLVEARTLWGRLVLHTRVLANLLRIHIYPTSPKVATLGVRHLALLGWMLKAFVRGESGESQMEALQAMLPATELQWMQQQNKKYYAGLSRIRSLCTMTLLSNNNNNNNLQISSLSSSIHLIVEERLRELELCVGGCERLFRSPIPPTYSRHLSRVLVLFILLLPMALVANGVPPLGVSLASALIFYVTIGIDEVGMEIENVFQLLPLQQLAAAAQAGVQEEFLSDMPPNGN